MSPPRLQIRYSAESRADIAEVLRYSRRRWGKDQRDAYQKLMQKTMAILAAEPGIGRNRDELRSGLQSHPVGSHLIYYLRFDNELRIMRILHNRRDPFLEDW